MIAKLFKHEFKAMFKLFFISWLVVIGLAVFVRLIYEYGISVNITSDRFSGGEQIRKIYNITYAVISIIYLFSIVALLLVFLLGAISRFYRHLFSNEGSFTLGLPVKVCHHYFCKFTVSFIYLILSLMAVAISFLIVGLKSNFFSELMLYLQATFEVLTLLNDTINLKEFIPDYAMLVFLTLISSLLQYYTAIIYGQKFKHKVIGSLLCYFIIYLILQALFMGLMFLVIMITMDIRMTISTLIHIILITTLVVQLILLFVFYKVSLKRFKNKVSFKN